MTNTNTTKTLDALRAGVAGPVTRPDAAEDRAALAGFQLAQQHRPAALVEATSAADVRATVEFATAADLPVAVQATGHGRSVAIEGGVLISTSRLTEIRIDPRARTAWVAAGTNWGQVVEAAAEHGLAPLNGSAPNVGVVGYTLGGGSGLMARRYGFAADHVRRIEIVTADGRLREVDADHDPDLFWALRGAGMNFGVVTGIEIELFEIRRLYGGTLFFDTDLVGDVVDAYRDWTPTVPEELTSSVVLLQMPDIPQVPEPIRGRYVARVHIAYTGDPETGERLIAPLRAVGPTLLDSVRDLPYTDGGTIYDEPPMPHAYVGDNLRLRELDPAALREALAVVGPEARVMCIVDIRHQGGALARDPEVANAVDRDEAPYLLRILSPFSAEDARTVADVQRRFFAAVGPWANGRSLNFIYRPGTSTTAEELREIYGAANYERLTELKATYDPANTFRINHNVTPAATRRDHDAVVPLHCGHVSDDLRALREPR
jgi:FAD/FMN-containing dehydrogenase